MAGCGDPPTRGRTLAGGGDSETEAGGFRVSQPNSELLLGEQPPKSIGCRWEADRRPADWIIGPTCRSGEARAGSKGALEKCIHSATTTTIIKRDNFHSLDNSGFTCPTGWIRLNRILVGNVGGIVVTQRAVEADRDRLPPATASRNSGSLGSTKLIDTLYGEASISPRSPVLLLFQCCRSSGSTWHSQTQAKTVS